MRELLKSRSGRLMALVLVGVALFVVSVMTLWVAQGGAEAQPKAEAEAEAEARAEGGGDGEHARRLVERREEERERQLAQEYWRRYGRGERVLFAVAHCSEHQARYVERQLEEVVSWCEAGFDVEVILDTCASVHLNASHLFDVPREEKMHCFRTGGFVPVRIVDHVPGDLTAFHRSHMKAAVAADPDRFDFFVYAEDDMLITTHNLLAVVEETKRVWRIARPEFARRVKVGLLRYENAIGCVTDEETVMWKRKVRRLNFLLDHPDHQGPRNEIDQAELLSQRLLWEYRFVLIEEPGVGLYFSPVPAHGAAWVLSKEQIFHLQAQCKFLDLPPDVDLSNERFKGTRAQFVAFANFLMRGCHMATLVPVGPRIQAFLVHHMPDKNRHRRPTDKLLNVAQLTQLHRNRNGTLLIGPEKSAPIKGVDVY